MEMKPWDIARSLSDRDLYNFKGQMIPWPPSDEDVLWWARKIKRLHQLKKSMDNGFTCTNKFEPHEPGLFGEYGFGVETGLRPWLQVWPDEIWYDYIFGGITIDVKTAVQASRDINLGLPLAEIERNKQTCGGKLSDIFVLAWLTPKILTLRAVEFLGWATREELLSAPIRTDWAKPGHAIHRKKLRQMIDLYAMISPKPLSCGPQLELFA